MIGEYPVHESRFVLHGRINDDAVKRDHEREVSIFHGSGYFEYVCAGCGVFKHFFMGKWKPGQVCYQCQCRLGLLPPFACRSCDDDMDDVTLYNRRQPKPTPQTVTSGTRLCAGCDEPLPGDSRPNKKTHNAACRQAAKRKKL